MGSPYDDGWLLDCVAVEIAINDPRTMSLADALRFAGDAREALPVDPVADALVTRLLHESRPAGYEPRKLVARK